MSRLSLCGLFRATPRRGRNFSSARSGAIALSVAALNLAFASVGAKAQPDSPSADAPQAKLLASLSQRTSRARLLRIVAFGSSSTEGVGASSPAGAYPAQLEVDLTRAMPKITVQVVNRGIGGEDVDDMLARLQSDVLTRNPDLVIWQTGSNDPLRNVPLDRFEAETRVGIAAIRAAGAAVMLMEPQWCPKLDETNGSGEFRDAVRRIGAALGVPVIRRTDLMHRWVAEGRISRDQMIAADGLHMTDRGYALLAKDVAAEILAATGPAPAQGAVSATTLPRTLVRTP